MILNQPSLMVWLSFSFSFSFSLVKVIRVNCIARESERKREIEGFTSELLAGCFAANHL